MLYWLKIFNIYKKSAEHFSHFMNPYMVSKMNYFILNKIRNWGLEKCLFLEHKTNSHGSNNQTWVF